MTPAREGAAGSDSAHDGTPRAQRSAGRGWNLRTAERNSRVESAVARGDAVLRESDREEVSRGVVLGKVGVVRALVQIKVAAS